MKKSGMEVVLGAGMLCGRTGLEQIELKRHFSISPVLADSVVSRESDSLSGYSLSAKHTHIVSISKGFHAERETCDRSRTGSSRSIYTITAETVFGKKIKSKKTNVNKDF